MKKLRVLMELRPGFEGFAGIPQETRLLFSAFRKMDSVELTGLINHPSRKLWPGLKNGFFEKRRSTDRRVFALSKFAISTKVDPYRSWLDRVTAWYQHRSQIAKLLVMTSWGMSYRTFDFDASLFGDFIWQTLFSRSLPASEFESIRHAKFASIRPSWDALQKVGLLSGLNGSFPLMRTSGYDVFIGQTPWPGRVSPGTSLVIRYHDAIPLFLPHTISSPRIHQYAHYAALRSNQKKGIFACTSHATRDDLLSIFPRLEKRTVVIPDIVSQDYYKEDASERYLANIIRVNVAVETEPRFLTSKEKENFYTRHLLAKPLQYLLMVSTIEPRKNHAKLIGAWEYIKNTAMPDLKLVLVGTPGWDYHRILDSMSPWQQRGELFHLQRVPAPNLRLLYGHACAVVCPSVAEGFDLSGIEAMLSGGPVVASDIKVHREIYADVADYFNPYSTLDQADAILRVIDPSRSEYRNELVRKGEQHGLRYRRDAIAPQWSEFFERIRRREFA